MHDSDKHPPPIANPAKITDPDQAARILQQAFHRGFFSRGYKQLRHQQYYGVNMLQQSRQNMAALKQRLGDLRPTEHSFYRYFNDAIVPRFTAKHATDDLTAIQRSGALVPTGDRLRKQDSRQNSRTGGSARQEYLYFVFGIGEDHPLPLFVGDNPAVIQISFADISKEDKTFFQGCFISNHDADYSRSACYGPVYFGDTSVTVNFDSKTMTKTTRFITAGKPVIEEIVSPHDEVIAVDKDTTILFDFLALKFIEYLRFLTEEFREHILKTRDFNVIKTVFSSFFPSHRFPELKLSCKRLPLTASFIKIINPDPNFHSTVYAIHKATSNTNVSMLEKLVTPLTVNFRNEDDDTPLVALLYRNNDHHSLEQLLATVKLLLTNGANINAKHFIYSSLALAIKFKLPQLTDMLLHGAYLPTCPMVRAQPTIDNQTLLAAVEVRDFALFERLLALQPTILNPNDFVLQVCKSINHKDDAQRHLLISLLPLIKDPNIFTHGKTLLMHAIVENWEWLLSELLKLPGIKINVQITTGNGSIAEFEGWGALHFAAWKGLAQSIEQLLAAGADSQLCDYFGHSPFAIVTQVLEGRRATQDIATQEHYQQVEANLALMFGKPEADKKMTKKDNVNRAKYERVLALLPTPTQHKNIDNVSQKLTYRTLAGVAIVSATIKDNRYVLLVRKASNDGMPYGYYLFPGGLAEMGEDLLTTAARETTEETNLSLIGCHAKSIHTYKIQLTPQQYRCTQFFHFDLGKIDALPKLYAKSDVAQAHWININALEIKHVAHENERYEIYHYRDQPIQQANGLLIAAIFFNKPLAPNHLDHCILTNYGQGEILHFLVTQLCDVNVDTTTKEKIKHKIIFLVQAALVNINARSNKGTTVLMLACALNQMDIVDFLIGLNADVNQQMSGSLISPFTPLQICLSAGHLLLAKHLIEKHHADVDIYRQGMSALSIACMSPNTDINFIKYLISRMRYLDESVIGSALLQTIEHDRIDVAKYLLSLRSMNLNSPYLSPGGKCHALKLAVMKEKVEFVRLFLQHGASCDIMLNAVFDIKEFALSSFNRCLSDQKCIEMELENAKRPAAAFQPTSFLFWMQSDRPTNAAEAITQLEARLAASKTRLQTIQQINLLLSNTLSHDTESNSAMTIIKPNVYP
jgi:ankyrin repeat protein/8-oxo-dGTP pyrophosphatase MutT (NUDIX family)